MTTEHTDHRWNDRAFWTLQRKVLAIALTVIAISGSVTLVWVCAQSAVDPYIECIAERRDSINHVPIQREIADIRAIEKKTDTNIQIIKSILEVLATSDQLLVAQQRRTNPTGIR
jgi:hypothetical protein